MVVGEIAVTKHGCCWRSANAGCLVEDTPVIDLSLDRPQRSLEIKEMDLCKDNSGLFASNRDRHLGAVCV